MSTTLIPTLDSLIPRSMQEFLAMNAHNGLLEQLSKINLTSADEFFTECQNLHDGLLGIGFNGVVFHNPTLLPPQIYKFSHLIFASNQQVRIHERQIFSITDSFSSIKTRWKNALSSSMFSKLNICESLNGVAQVGSTPPIAEICGALVWSHYTQTPALLPTLFTDDGLAYRRNYLPGVPLKNIFQLQKENESCLLNPQILWKKVVSLQKMGEQILRDCGVTVDLLNPANLLITGSAEDFSMDFIDIELVGPTAEAKQYYRETEGITIPEPIFTDMPIYVQWPVMPEHIVMSKVWDLSFEQSLDYLQALHECSRNSAIKRLAQLPHWEFTLAPYSRDLSNIKKAKQVLDGYSDGNSLIDLSL